MLVYSSSSKGRKSENLVQRTTFNSSTFFGGSNIRRTIPLKVALIHSCFRSLICSSLNWFDVVLKLSSDSNSDEEFDFASSANYWNCSNLTMLNVFGSPSSLVETTSPIGSSYWVRHCIKPDSTTQCGLYFSNEISLFFSAEARFF